MIEFAFVGVLLILLLTGIITFGLLLSFKQNLTQAAAEGARAGAVAQSGNSVTAAQTATAAAVDSFDQACSPGGPLTCTPTTAPCDALVPSGPQCITVEVTYDYDADPIFPEFPILSGLYPDSISASSTAEVNP